jgi:hypothetical protein
MLGKYETKIRLLPLELPSAKSVDNAFSGT